MQHYKGKQEICANGFQGTCHNQHTIKTMDTYTLQINTLGKQFRINRQRKVRTFGGIRKYYMQDQLVSVYYPLHIHLISDIHPMHVLFVKHSKHSIIVSQVERRDSKNLIISNHNYRLN